MASQEPIVLERSIKRRRNRGQRAFVFVLLGVLAAGAVTAWFALRPRGDRYELAAWTSAVVRRQDIQDTLEVSGTVSAERSQAVVSLQRAQVARVLVKSGDAVRAGQTIATLESRQLEEDLADLQAQLGQARRDLERLEVQHRYELAQMDRQRPALERAVADAEKALATAERLAASQLASQKDVDTARAVRDDDAKALADHDAARENSVALHTISVEDKQAGVAAMEESVRRQERSIAECTIASPLAGRVTDVAAKEGDWVSPYEPVATVSDTARPILTLNVPEGRIAYVKPGQPVTIAYGDLELRGHVRSVALQAETGSSGTTVPVEVGFDQVPDNIVQGSTATGEILLGVKAGAFVLPRGPWMTTGSGTYVYRIEGAEAVRTEVVLGLVQPQTVEVLTGLREGDEVITSGYQEFIDRDVISLRQPADRHSGGGGQ